MTRIRSDLGPPGVSINSSLKANSIRPLIYRRQEMLSHLECGGRAKRRRRFGLIYESLNTHNPRRIDCFKIGHGWKPIQSAVAASFCRRTPNHLTFLDVDLSFLDRANSGTGVYLDHETSCRSRFDLCRSHYACRTRSQRGAGESR